MPRALNRVPALRHDKRETRVNVDGKPVFDVRVGDDAAGILMVLTKPLMAEVNIFEESKAPRSLSDSLDLKSTNGCIMKEFHSKPELRESRATVASSENLLPD